jgi:hypothetical protein
MLTIQSNGCYCACEEAPDALSGIGRSVGAAATEIARIEQQLMAVFH